jgi:uracil-DNA glycosylase
MNPSHRRFPELEYAFGGSKFDQGTGIKFVKILEDLQIKERSFIDNLCHCSTLTNSINSTQATNCFRYLLRELDLSKPSKIIAMGSKVHDILEFLLEDHDEHRQRLREIHHPNFVISYRRSLMTEYVERIRQICS